MSKAPASFGFGDGGAPGRYYVGRKPFRPPRMAFSGAQARTKALLRRFCEAAQRRVRAAATIETATKLAQLIPGLICVSPSGNPYRQHARIPAALLPWLSGPPKTRLLTPPESIALSIA